MRIGASLLLIAVGAILRFAIDSNHQNAHGFNVGTAGVILMIVGAIGLLVTLAIMSTRRRTEIISRGAMGTRETTYVEPANPVDGPY